MKTKSGRRNNVTKIASNEFESQIIKDLLRTNIKSIITSKTFVKQSNQK